ncbi:MAG: hypothetical protein QOJ90_109 [Actinomycetota bacterium]|nr:hypothetical protein [Actinomycetota bacterium]MDQ1640758.1 hypothetical protein [Actinomycetota bacterium]
MAADPIDVAATARSGPVVSADAVTFRVADPGRTLAGVRLCQEVRVPGDLLGFRFGSDGWELRLARPAVARMEYLVELEHPGGRREVVPDPANPARVPGAFGEKSVVEFPGYRAPWWVGAPAPAGRTSELAVAARSVADHISGTLWEPAGCSAAEPLPLLVVHDGPEYDALAHLTAYLAVMIDRGQLPRLRAALLAPGPRDDWYSGNGAYTRALCLAVLPRLRAIAPATAVIGMGTSLGALAMLHAQRRHGGSFDALFLQSGSFFHPSFDAHERRFAHYERVVRGVDAVLRAGGHSSPVPVVLTCGQIEENLENNRVMARALAAQRYDVALHEVPDVHNYTAWRDAFHPYLTRLLRMVAA